MAVAFLPILAMPPLADTLEDVADAPSLTAALVMAPALLTASLLGLGSALVYPFEMDTVVRLSGDRLVATHYGLYNTVSGIAITLGNLAIGAAPGLDAPIAAIAPWLALAALGAVGAVSLTMIGRSGGITNTSPPTGSPAARTR
ncbi:hypothetical protein [Nocardiopsis tropica]|uniref:MFS transporter n=1 Tax=Nocardiopsis tropica TaxID=109330 RepID=A0ABU7KLC9_9ACTN|nr:hypothetical protein [Nocardiopsis umidischolae]MEE2050096.1 hypothetical protein [Nocardiopsis umidischolae]